jgi:hypothetical protein
MEQSEVQRQHDAQHADPAGGQLIDSRHPRGDAVNQQDSQGRLGDGERPLARSGLCGRGPAEKRLAVHSRPEQQVSQHAGQGRPSGFGTLGQRKPLQAQIDGDGQGPHQQPRPPSGPQQNHGRGQDRQRHPAGAPGDIRDVERIDLGAVNGRHGSQLRRSACLLAC